MVFQPRVSLCLLVCPGTHSVDKTGLRLTEIHVPWPPSAGIKGLFISETPFLLKTGFLCVVLPVLNLNLQNKVALTRSDLPALGSLISKVFYHLSVSLPGYQFIY